MTPEIEQAILQRWAEEKTFDKLRRWTAVCPRWSFLDGPITANNPMGVHHAWGRTYKDIFCRYQAMCGHQLRWQSGFDCHGLWVEVEVEKELGFKSKQDIERYGLDRFADLCRARVERYAARITEQSVRLGQWNDWDNSYYTMSRQNIDAIWRFLKVCHDRNLLYRGTRVMPWCPRCGTSLSQHELADCHREVSDESVYFHAWLPGRAASFLVWTTTPWTIPANRAVALHPDLDYALCRLPDGRRTWVLKSRVEAVVPGAVVENVRPGRQFLGVAYQPLLKFKDEPPGRFILWEGVSAEEGTGAVHIAPGCGAEDYELGERYGIPAYCPVNESGLYYQDHNLALKGFPTSEGNVAVLRAMTNQGDVLRVEPYKHRYPHCWRCRTPLIFRPSEEWFIRTDPLRARLKEEAAKVKWVPEYAGLHMQNWLDNMGDWCISRRRFWGLPLPFYFCEDGHLTVLGAVPEGGEPHRPWVDGLRGPCLTCGKESRRISEVGDCWLDAGIAPISTMPPDWFPADLVTEMREQVRLWFYATLFMSVVLTDKAPYRTVHTYEAMLDEQGEPLSKTKGNAPPFDEVVEKVGADPMRWAFAAAPVGQPLRFGLGPVEESQRKLKLLLNCYEFYSQYDKTTAGQPTALDRWIIARLDQTVRQCRESLDEYNTTRFVATVDEFVSDLSTWYIRLSRKRPGIGNVLGHILFTLAKLVAPVIPFTAEYLWGKVSKEGSVHCQPYPYPAAEYDQQLIDAMKVARTVTRLGHAARNKAGVKVRMPLACAWVRAPLAEELIPLVAEELNVKRVELYEGDGIPLSDIRGNVAVAQEHPFVVALDTAITSELQAEGNAREFTRHVQARRKALGLNHADRIEVLYYPEADFLQLHAEAVKAGTGADSLTCHAQADEPATINGRTLHIRLLYKAPTPK